MIRKPLGRGLGALIESTSDEDRNGAATGPGATGLLTVAVDRIAPSPYQPRKHFDPERLEELARAIQSQGVIEPLVVRPIANGDAAHPMYELIAGERRLRAARSAGLTEVPVVVREVDERAALEISLVENLAREELNAIEEARAFVQLNREFSLSHEQIAARIGKSRPYVSNIVRLLDLPAPVIEMIETGELTAGQARPLLAIAGAEAQIATARKIVASGISARGAEQIAGVARKATRKTARNAAAAARDANLQALIDTLQRALKRKVRIVSRRGSAPGRIEIDYYDDQDLTALAAMITGQGAGRSAHLY
ncbi:MAG: ParB/RepB/Spo0J family partition protein [Candidatus Binataceae bacterium]|jgi:ParB family chromosome partitioning protein